MDDARLARLLTRARYVLLPEPAIEAMVASLRAGEAAGAGEAVTALETALDARAVGGLLASALRGEATLDAMDGALVDLAGEGTVRLASFLGKVEAQSAVWGMLLDRLAANGNVAASRLDGALLGLASQWVDGESQTVSALGEAVLARAEAGLAGFLAAMVERAEGALATGPEVLRAELVATAAKAQPPRRGLLAKLVEVAPVGERGALATLWWESDAGAEDTVHAMAEGPASVDRNRCLEALLQRAPDSVIELARRVVRTEPVPPPPHDRLPIQAVAVSALGARDPLRWADALGGVIRQVQGPWALEALARLPFTVARPHLAWMASHTPGHLGLRAMETVLASPWEGRAALVLSAMTKAERELRAVLLTAATTFSPAERSAFGVWLDHTEVDLRLAAAELLAGINDAKVTALLSDRLVKERSPRVRAKLASALGQSEPEGVKEEVAKDDPRRVVEAALEAAAKGRPRGMAAWYAASKAPGLKWRDGAAVVSAAGLAMLRWQMESGSLAPAESVIELVAELDRDSVAKWALAVLKLWVGAGAPVRDHAVLSLAVALAEDAVWPLLGEAVEGWSRASRTALVAEVIELAVALGTDAGLRFVDAIADAHLGEGVGLHAAQQLVVESEARGVDVGAMMDATVPRLGFARGDEGLMGEVLVAGGRRFRVMLEGWEPVLVDSIGRRHTSLPKTTKGGDASAAAARWAFLEAAFPQLIVREEERLWEALREGRRWSVEGWLRDVVGHPLMSRLVTGLLWQHDDGATARLDREGVLRDVRGEAVTWTAGAVVLAHAVEMDDAVVDAWRARQSVAPMDAVLFGWERPRFAEGDSVSGWVVRAKSDRGHKVRQPWEAVKGWRPMPTAGGVCPGFVRHHRALGVDAVLSVDGIALWAEHDRTATVTGLAFVEEGAVVEVAPRVYAETRADLSVMLEAG